MSVRPGLADAVVRQLLVAVEDGTYPVGARLPPEAALAQGAGVSRLTLREAVRVLRDKGVLRVEQGRGTFVNPPERWAALDAELLSSRIVVEGDLVRTARLVTEVRSLFEVGAAGLAAQRRGAEHLLTLGTTLERMRSTVANEDVTEFSAADLAFHEAVMEAAGNPLLTALMQPIRAMMVQVREKTSLTLDMRETAVAAHAAIHAAIASGDPVLARRTMTEHMAETQRVIERLAAAGPGAPTTSEELGVNAVPPPAGGPRPNLDTGPPCPEPLPN